MSGRSPAGSGSPDQGEEPLAGVAGDELSAGISESGVGGQLIGEGEGDETGLDQIVEEASHNGFGRPQAPEEG